MCNTCLLKVWQDAIELVLDARIKQIVGDRGYGFPLVRLPCFEPESSTVVIDSAKIVTIKADMKYVPMSEYGCSDHHIGLILQTL